MAELVNNTKEQEVRTSKLAVFPLIIPILLFSGAIILALFGSSTILHIIMFLLSSPVGVVLSIIALLLISKSKGALKGKFLAISGIIVSLAILFLITFVYLTMYNAIFREKPYDEPIAQNLIAKIENNCDIKLPSKMDFIRTADKISAGIDRPYIFIIRYTTDQNGFDKLKGQLDKDYWAEITDEFYKRKDNNYLYERIADYGWYKNAPNWCKDKSPKGRVYESYLNSRKIPLLLETICIEVEDTNEVEIIMMGHGAHRLKEANNISIINDR